jgi:hypothetical protein
MVISKSIVEKICSMDPPGRFLKQCPDTGEWIELSLKDAATRTSQAMAYAVRERAKQRKERRSLRLQRDAGAVSSSHPAGDQPFLPSYVKVHNNKASTVSASTARGATTGQGGEVDSASNEDDDDDESGGGNEVPITENSSRQQLLHQLQQAAATTLPNSGPAPLNGLVELIAQAQQQQQQQLLLRQLLGQFPLGLQTQLPPNTLSMLAPSLSFAQGTLLPNHSSNILRQASALPQAQGSALMGSLQQTSLLQQNQVQSQPSRPINTQALLGLLGMLQNQPPSLLAPAPTHLTSQLPSLSQQLHQVYQNQQNQVQQDVLQNQLLASLLAPQNPLHQQQSSQPLNLLQQQATLLQQQIAQNYSAPNPNESKGSGS